MAMAMLLLVLPTVTAPGPSSSSIPALPATATDDQKALYLEQKYHQTTLRSLDSVTSMSPVARRAMVNAMTATEVVTFSSMVKAYVVTAESTPFVLPLPTGPTFPSVGWLQILTFGLGVTQCVLTAFPPTAATMQGTGMIPPKLPTGEGYPFLVTIDRLAPDGSVIHAALFQFLVPMGQAGDLAVYSYDCNGTCSDLTAGVPSGAVASNAGNYTVTLTGTSGLVGTFTPVVAQSPAAGVPLCGARFPIPRRITASGGSDPALYSLFALLAIPFLLCLLIAGLWYRRRRRQSDDVWYVEDPPVIPYKVPVSPIGVRPPPLGYARGSPLPPRSGPPPVLGMPLAYGLKSPATMRSMSAELSPDSRAGSSSGSLAGDDAPPADPSTATATATSSTSTAASDPW